MKEKTNSDKEHPSLAASHRIQPTRESDAASFFRITLRYWPIITALIGGLLYILGGIITLQIKVEELQGQMREIHDYLIPRHGHSELDEPESAKQKSQDAGIPRVDLPR